MKRMTFSAYNAARNCQKKYELRYLQDLRPKVKPAPLAFGSIIHSALELWHSIPDDADRLQMLLDSLDQAYPNREADTDEKASWQLARAMMLGYASRYPQERFEVIATEREFEASIVNPETGRESRSFHMAGKVDAIVRLPDGLYVMEHKTAGSITGDYLERLWCDTQIAAYAYFLRQNGIPIVGVLYNILVKSRLKQREGETEKEYEERCRLLAAKNKSGKTSAKRQEPESDDEYMGRLCDWYAQPEAFHRERIYLSEDRFDMLREEIWQGCQMLLEARRRGKYLMNTHHCFHWNRACEYFPYCQSGFNPVVRDNLYEIAAPHEELSAPDPAF